MHEDSDVRIASDHPSREIEQKQSFSADEFMKESGNGNLQQAHILGAVIAGEVYDANGESLFGVDGSEDARGIQQRKVLFAFAAVIGFEKYMPNSHCTQAALSVFYQVLGREAPDIYDYIENSFAFSFYLLEERKGQHVYERVGERFAMLCNRDDYKELGETLYLHFLDFIHGRVLAAGFVTEREV